MGRVDRVGWVVRVSRDGWVGRVSREGRVGRLGRVGRVNRVSRVDRIYRPGDGVRTEWTSIRTFCESLLRSDIRNHVKSSINHHRTLMTKAKTLPPLPLSIYDQQDET